MSKRIVRFAGLLILLVGCLLLWQITHSSAQRPSVGDLPALIVLVRHAEFANESPENPPLSAEGNKRALELASTLSNVRFSGIITSQLKRTRETAQPVAALLGLTPEIVPLDSNNPGAYVDAVGAALKKYRGSSVLVVSHSIVGPRIIAALGGPSLPSICDTVFDDLFVLAPVDGKMQMVQSRYGLVSSTRGPDCR